MLEKEIYVRVAFVIIYLVVDVAYVLMSRGVYEGRVKVIQGNGYPPKALSIPVAGLAYVFMAIAWWVLVAERLSRSSSMTEALRLAIVFSLAVYGVFNATLYVMFDEWNASIFVRDLAWGMAWLSTLTLLYTFALRRFV